MQLANVIRARYLTGLVSLFNLLTSDLGVLVWMYLDFIIFQSGLFKSIHFD